MVAEGATLVSTRGNAYSSTQRKMASNVISFKKERNKLTAYCVIRQPKKARIKATVSNFSDRKLTILFLPIDY